MNLYGEVVLVSACLLQVHITGYYPHATNSNRSKEGKKSKYLNRIIWSGSKLNRYSQALTNNLIYIFQVRASSGEFDSFTFQLDVLTLITVKLWKFGHPKNYSKYPKIWAMWLYHMLMYPKDTDRMANSLTYQIAPKSHVALFVWVRTVQFLLFIKTTPSLVKMWQLSKCIF